MGQRIALVSLVVPDYDEAIAFYVGSNPPERLSRARGCAP